jgi:predicted HicB family RNase H-like nuclease
VTRAGVTITRGLAEKLADEAEAGYDLSRGRRVGRPSLAGRSGASPRVNFRATPALHERARRRAKREGKTISQVAREALEKYVA